MLRSKAAIEAQVAYQEEMRRTPEGAAIDDLRQEAIAFAQQGDRETAHRMFLAAVTRCAPDDDGPLAAACCFDLADSFANLASGVEVENLLEARRLLERSLRSRLRQQTPLRLALTSDALGRILRRLSVHAGPQQTLLLTEARRLILRACEVVEACGPVGLVEAAGYRNNLGNLLAQGGEWDAAERNYRLALRHWDNALTDPTQLALDFRPPEHQVALLTLLGLSRTQIARGRREDTASVLAQLDRVIREGRGNLPHHARLLTADALLTHRPDQIEVARANLSAVDPRGLDRGERRNFVSLLERAGLSDLAMGAAQLALQEAMVTRATSIADHVSDHLAAEAQWHSLAIAGLHADAGQPEEAFLALEATAALRYFELVLGYSWTPRDPVSRALANRSHSLANAAKYLEEIVGRISGTSEAEQRDVLAETERMARELAPPAASRDTPLLHQERIDAGFAINPLLAEALAAALASSSLKSTLEREARKLGDESLRVSALLLAREPDSDRAKRSLDAEMDPTALRRVLDEHPGTVFVRVHLRDELFAVAVWSEGGRTVGKTLRRELTADARATLVKLYAGHPAEAGSAATEPAVFTELPSLLRALSLDEVLPAGNIAHLVVLPSALAALVPWAASGNATQVLIDRVEALSYAPNLTPFVLRQDVPGGRAGTLLVAPGEACEGLPTQFHGDAFAEVGVHETTLFGAAATRAALQRAAQTADVVSLYTHGQHEIGEGASIMLADGPLSTESLDPSWIGCERVEFWACQSGVNTTTDWLTPLVDEAFGLDVAFHHAGVRSTIGSLWSVSDFITAHLVQRYRRALAEGETPPQALVTAQRWWRTDVVARLPALLADTPKAELARAIGGLLGGTVVTDELDAMLTGVRPDAPLASYQQADLLRRLSAPEAWAAFRFMGVANRRPIEPAGDEARPMSEAERAELAALLTTGPSTVHRGTPRSRGA